MKITLRINPKKTPSLINEGTIVITGGTGVGKTTLMNKIVENALTDDTWVTIISLKPNSIAHYESMGVNGKLVGRESEVIPSLNFISKIVNYRELLLLNKGVSTIEEYNAIVPEDKKLLPIVLAVEELPIWDNELKILNPLINILNNGANVGVYTVLVSSEGSSLSANYFLSKTFKSIILVGKYPSHLLDLLFEDGRDRIKDLREYEYIQYGVDGETRSFI